MTNSRSHSGEAGTQQRDPVPVFFSSWLRAPLKVASIVPSSRHLATVIARQIDPTRPGWVIELGAGTGPVTEQLLARGIPPKRLLVVERDPALSSFLRDRFPEPLLVEGDALRLRELVAPYGANRVHAVVCGLPLLSMPKADAAKLLHGCLEIMEPDGLFFQYTYSLFSPLRYREYGLVPHSVRRVLLNIPPAAVWSYRRADAGTAAAPRQKTADPA